jgi:hypothetical protein
MYSLAGKNVSKCFFSETTWTIESKLPRNDHWNILYQGIVFYADRKSKMAATAGHKLTLDPMGNGGGHLGFLIGIKNSNLVKDISMIIPGQFAFNCPSGIREEAF